MVEVAGKTKSDPTDLPDEAWTRNAPLMAIA
jgi:hypothetical protein